MQRPTYAEVDLSAIRDNIAAIRARVGEKTLIMPAVKANGYGHGAIPVAKACVKAGANALCVSCIQEAMELREAGIDSPILILGCSLPNAVPYIIKQNISCTVCDYDFAKLLSDAAIKLKSSAKVHIKIDTGMGRIGATAAEAVDLAQKVAALPGIDIEGVFTHFPSADEEDRQYTTEQIGIYHGIVSAIRASGVPVRIAHASNSGAILAYPETDLDAVRPGIMIYGYYPSGEVTKSIELKPALTLKSHIVFLKESNPGCSISYGRTHVLERNSKIATIPIGYADGYFRTLSNRGLAAVRGAKVPIVGRICMDQCMIDVTDVPNVSIDDEVILYGGGYDYLSVSAIAEQIGTISYELLCAIGNRISRVYINE